MPNYNIELEEDLLGSIIFSGDNEATLFDLPDDLFYVDHHKKAYQKIRENHDKGLPLDNGIDIKSLSAFAGKFLPSIKSGITELQQLSRARNLHQTLQKSILSLSQEGNPDHVANQLISALSDLSKNDETTATISDSLFSVFTKINEIRDGEKQLGLTTGLDFEKHIGGFENGKFYVVAARPAMGKSAFALEIIKRIASDGVPVGMMSLEMSNDSLALRLLTSDVQIDAGDIRKGKLSDDQMDKIQESCNHLAKLPIYFDDNSYVTASSLRSKASYFKSKYGISMLVIDYLQLMTGDNDSRERDIAEISRMCKVIAKELEIPVLALAQLNRGVEVRDDKRPRLSDLRESGAIEQDADAVMMLYRPEYYGIETYPDSEDHTIRGTSTKNICEVIISKNRDGETGIVRQVFIPNLMVFKNRAPHWSEGMQF
jgi:replicative DNA helicase